MAGLVWLAHGQIFMQPWAIMTQQRALVLEAETSSTQQLPSSLTLGQLQSCAEIVEHTLSLLIQCLRIGLRHQTHASHTRLLQQVGALAEHGFSSCAAQLEPFAKNMRNQQLPQHVLQQISQLTLLLTSLVMR